ncbi:hypothetical protein QL285_012487 [Trifolium repens]|nr:hypothetical protein QL285_012487 [Trifolium repens]
MVIHSTTACSLHLEPPSKITGQFHDLGVSLHLLPASITSFSSSLGMPSALMKILSPTTIGFFYSHKIHRLLFRLRTGQVRTPLKKRLLPTIIGF